MTLHQKRDQLLSKYLDVFGKKISLTAHHVIGTTDRKEQ